MESLNSTNKIPMKEQLTSFLEALNYKYRVNQEDDERIVIQTGIILQSGNAETYLVYVKSLHLVEIFSVAPIKVPENKRTEVAKFLDFIDSVSYLGNMQLNHRDGELRCKTYFLGGENAAEIRVINDNFFESLNQLERYLPSILNISFGGIDATRAIHELTGTINPTDN